MKKLIVLVAAIGLLGCSTVAVKKDLTPQQRCEEISAQVDSQTETYIADSLIAEDQYMYATGGLIAHNMDKEKHIPVPVNMFMKHRNLTVKGFMEWAMEKDGLYLIENSCDYQAGELVGWRLDRKQKVVRQ